jgi:hypothetical protein
MAFACSTNTDACSLKPLSSYGKSAQQAQCLRLQEQLKLLGTALEVQQYGSIKA